LSEEKTEVIYDEGSSRANEGKNMKGLLNDCQSSLWGNGIGDGEVKMQLPEVSLTSGLKPLGAMPFAMLALTYSTNLFWFLTVLTCGFTARSVYKKAIERDVALRAHAAYTTVQEHGLFEAILFYLSRLVFARKCQTIKNRLESYIFSLAVAHIFYKLLALLGETGRVFVKSFLVLDAFADMYFGVTVLFKPVQKLARKFDIADTVVDGFRAGLNLHVLLDAIASLDDFIASMTAKQTPRRNLKKFDIVGDPQGASDEMLARADHYLCTEVLLMFKGLFLSVGTLLAYATRLNSAADLSIGSLLVDQGWIQPPGQGGRYARVTAFSGRVFIHKSMLSSIDRALVFCCTRFGYDKEGYLVKKSQKGHGVFVILFTVIMIIYIGLALLLCLKYAHKCSEDGTPTLWKRAKDKVFGFFNHEATCTKESEVSSVQGVALSSVADAVQELVDDVQPGISVASSKKKRSKKKGSNFCTGVPINEATSFYLISKSYYLTDSDGYCPFSSPLEGEDLAAALDGAQENSKEGKRRVSHAKTRPYRKSSGKGGGFTSAPSNKAKLRDLPSKKTAGSNHLWYDAISRTVKCGDDHVGHWDGHDFYSILDNTDLHDLIEDPDAMHDQLFYESRQNCVETGAGDEEKLESYTPNLVVPPLMREKTGVITLDHPTLGQQAGTSVTGSCFRLRIEFANKSVADVLVTAKHVVEGWQTASITIVNRCGLEIVLQLTGGVGFVESDKFDVAYIPWKLVDTKDHPLIGMPAFRIRAEDAKGLNSYDWSSVSCALFKNSGSIAVGNIVSYSDSVTYTASSESGDSGSAVLAKVNNMDMVVAVHKKGNNDQSTNSGVSIMNVVQLVAENPFDGKVFQ